MHHGPPSSTSHTTIELPFFPTLKKTNGNMSYCMGCMRSLPVHGGDTQAGSLKVQSKPHVTQGETDVARMLAVIRCPVVPWPGFTGFVRLASMAYWHDPRISLSLIRAFHIAR